MTKPMIEVTTTEPGQPATVVNLSPKGGGILCFRASKAMKRQLSAQARARGVSRSTEIRDRVQWTIDNPGAPYPARHVEAKWQLFGAFGVGCFTGVFAWLIRMALS